MKFSNGFGSLFEMLYLPMCLHVVYTGGGGVHCVYVCCMSVLVCVCVCVCDCEGECECMCMCVVCVYMYEYV